MSAGHIPRLRLQGRFERSLAILKLPRCWGLNADAQNTNGKKTTIAKAAAEYGFSDRLPLELPRRSSTKLAGSANMMMIILEDTLILLRATRHEIIFPAEIHEGAEKAVRKVFELF